MFGLGLFEILFIAVLGLLLIGPEQLPEVTKALARFLTDLRRSTNALKSDFEAHAGANLLKLDEDRRKKSENPGGATAEEEMPLPTSSEESIDPATQVAQTTQEHVDKKSGDHSSGGEGEHV